MATRKRRDVWHQHKQSGIWTCSLGIRGLRVRLFQKRRDGSFYRSVWLADEERYDVKSLCTADRDEARRLGEQLLGELLKDGAPKVTGKVQLGQLWRRYRVECEDFLDNVERTRRDAETRIAILIGHFGENFDVSKLTKNDVRRYEKERLAGGIEYVLDGAARLAKQRTPASRMRRSTKKKVRLTELQEQELREASSSFVSGPTRARSAEADLVLLDAMLTWATTVWARSGQRWLESNPIAGVRRRPEKNPQRPIATWDRYLATRAALRALAQRELDAHHDREEKEGKSLPIPDSWHRWVKIELALVLAEATGRRLGAIRQLRWEHVNFDAAEITWVADSDKKGVEWVTPVPARLLGELREFRSLLGAIGGLMFGGARKPDQAMDRHLFDKWLVEAEGEANLLKLTGGLWHPYRRKWAMERKHLPLTDVAAVGGWKDVGTLLSCYSQPDRQTMLDVMGETSKLRDVTPASGGKVPALSRDTQLEVMVGVR